MKDKSTIISARIVFMFTCAIATSIIPDEFPDFFGDIICNGITMNASSGKMETFFHYGGHHIDTVVHYGYRHWLFFLMGLCLFTVQVVKIFQTIEKN